MKQIPEYTNSQISRLIDEHIHSERDRKLLKRRFIDGIKFEPLAEESGLSVAQVKRVYAKAKTRLFAHIPP